MTPKHPSWEAILETIESAGARGRGALDHVETCARCRLLAEEARTLLSALEAAGIRGPSDTLKDRVWSLLDGEIRHVVKRRTAGDGRAAPDVAQGMGSGLREVWANLVADSLRPSLAVRGSVRAIPRAVVYETDDYAISLSIAPDPKSETVRVMGQVIPRMADSIPPGGRAKLCSGHTWLEETLSEHGEFRFGPVPKDGMEIVVDVGNLRIRLEPLSS